MNPYFIRDWSIQMYPDAYRAPEDQPARIHGKVYGDPRFADGTLIMTALIKSIDLDNEMIITHEAPYKLGQKDACYQLHLDQYSQRG